MPNTPLDELEDIFQNLTRLETEARLFLEEAPDVCMLIQGERVGYVNRQCVRLLGWEPEEVEGLRWSILAHPEDIPDAERALERAREVSDALDERCISVQVRWRTPKGTWRPVDWRLRHSTSVPVTFAIGRVQDAGL